MARLVLFLAVLVALATQMIVLADGVDDSDVDVFTVNSNDETLSVTTTLDVKGTLVAQHVLVNGAAVLHRHCRVSAQGIWWKE